MRAGENKIDFQVWDYVRDPIDTSSCVWMAAEASQHSALNL